MENQNGIIWWITFIVTATSVTLLRHTFDFHTDSFTISFLAGFASVAVATCTAKLVPVRDK